MTKFLCTLEEAEFLVISPGLQSEAWTLQALRLAVFPGAN